MSERLHIRLFNFGRANRLALSRVSNEDGTAFAGWWLNGRIFGHYISRLFGRVGRGTTGGTDGQ
jgi:hypothetical protein